MAPLRQGHPISAPGFFVAGDDRNFIVLDLAAEDSWRAVSREFARLLLNFNYPPTQDWFDEGFAQYFSSLRLGDNQAQVGGDPAQNQPWDHALPGDASANPREIVRGIVRWPVAAYDQILFMMRSSAPGYPPMFYAQSWIVMHYLLNQNKLSDAGTYFGLVEIQKLPVEQAIQQAFGVSAAEFEQAVKDYFRSSHGRKRQPTPSRQIPPLQRPGLSVPAVARSRTGGKQCRGDHRPTGAGLIAEMMVRLPEHRAQARKGSGHINNDPKTESAVAHRGLAWAHLDRKEFDQSTEELARAMELDPHDPWVRYYSALVKFRAADSGRKPIQGVSNMIQDLIAVVDWNPDFAEAHNMLAMGRLAGGGVHSATDSIKIAIQLSPRNQQYLLNLAQIDLAGKKWDDATALLEQLKDSLNPQIAQTARKSLADLPTLKKYGVLPQPEPPQPAKTATASTVPKAPATTSAEKSDDDSGDEQNAAAPAEPLSDKRKTLFLKGKLASVDCTQTPAAILTVRSGAEL